jgi:hypothetical protein
VRLNISSFLSLLHVIYIVSDVTRNMIMRKLLHEPNVFYIVMTRDYSDMLW